MRGRFALGVVVIFALLLGLSSLGFDNSPRTRGAQFTPPPTPTNTLPPVPPTDTPTATTIILPSDTPSPTGVGVPPTNTPPPGAATTRAPKPPGEPPFPSRGVKVNACSRVVRPDGLNLGDAPGFSSSHIQIVGLGEVVFVIDGPQRVDGLWWWRMRLRSGVVGWGIDDHLAPFTGECFGTAITETPAAPLSAAAAVAVTPLAGKSELPATGSGDAWPIVIAGVLAFTLLVAGLIRRRNQGTI